MRLEDIGFYTLKDERVKSSSETTQLYRCELILTSACNFSCPYCRGIKDKKSLSYDEALRIINLWCNDNLKNVRFSGGEPTLWKRLSELVNYCKRRGVERIAISTNGYAERKLYDELLEAGVNDFSISLDACCASTGDMMAGNIKDSWKKVIENIEYLAKKTYVTVGIVLTENNIDEFKDTVILADKLGVADIRVISSAQWNKNLIVELPEDVINRHPILKYRLNRNKIRGISVTDNHECPLVLDDMAVVNGYHYPCIIYLREGGKPIGKVGSKMRKERKQWFDNHDVFKDEICNKNCLDVCVQFNNSHWSRRSN